MRTTPINLTEADLELNGEEVVLLIEFPSGKRIQVVIPTFEGWESYAYTKDGTYWLNFVCDGHYS